MQLRSDGWYRRITSHDDENSLSSRMRRQRLSYVSGLIKDVSTRKNGVSIIDIGGETHYWMMLPAGFLEQCNVKITIVNLSKRGEDSGVFRYEEGNGCDLNYPDLAFDIAHSNSVIEHVGGWPEMQAFAKETRRVAACYYMQTPSFWFPIEPHFGLPGFHWLPHSARVALVSRYACGHYEPCRTREEATDLVNSARLLSKKQVKQLFPDAEILPERFMAINKSWMAIRSMT